LDLFFVVTLDFVPAFLTDPLLAPALRSPCFFPPPPFSPPFLTFPLSPVCRCPFCPVGFSNPVGPASALLVPLSWPLPLDFPAPSVASHDLTNRHPFFWSSFFRFYSGFRFSFTCKMPSCFPRPLNGTDKGISRFSGDLLGFLHLESPLVVRCPSWFEKCPSPGDARFSLASPPSRLS